jgi:hypothetical protein
MPTTTTYPNCTQCCGSGCAKCTLCSDAVPQGWVSDVLSGSLLWQNQPANSNCAWNPDPDQEGLLPTPASLLTLISANGKAQWDFDARYLIPGGGGSNLWAYRLVENLVGGKVQCNAPKVFTRQFPGKGTGAPDSITVYPIPCGGCGICAPVPAKWQATFAGVMDGSCQCASFNDSFTLSSTPNSGPGPCAGNPCVWCFLTGGPACLQGYGNLWNIVLGFGLPLNPGFWSLAVYTTLFGNPFLAALGTLPALNFNCLGVNTFEMTWFGQPGGGVGAPCTNGTATVQPA